MKGSEKQIEWAKNITSGWIAGINKMVKEANDRVTRNTMPQLWADICTSTAAEIIAIINTMDDAAIIISDSKKGDVVKAAAEIASARYDNVNK